MDLFELCDADEFDSPCLVVDADRVARNIDRMLGIVDGDPSRLRPHVKTHKMLDVVKLQLNASVTKFKTATLAETEMVAAAGAADVLLAHQPVAAKIERLADLVRQFAPTSFSTIVDDLDTVTKLADRLGNPANPFRLYIDIDCGMHRTGVPLGPQVDALMAHIESLPGVRLAGLHVYDGHIHQPALNQRRQAAVEVIDQVRAFVSPLGDLEVIGGGSPTFAIWAEQTDWQCSPGTSIFWDVGYGADYPELEFEVAAALLTRVISKSGEQWICFDLGHKAVSSEMPMADRVVLPAIPDARFIGHSEEHFVVETSQASRISVGDAFLAFPRHICPSVADYVEAIIIRGGTASGETWPIVARR